MYDTDTWTLWGDYVGPDGRPGEAAEAPAPSQLSCSQRDCAMVPAPEGLGNRK